MKFISNKTTKKIFVVGVLMVLVLFSGTKPAKAINFGVLDNIVLGQIWISGATKESLTEDVSGIVKDSNGRIVSAKNNSTFGIAYNNMMKIGDTKGASDLAADMSILYDKILPLEAEKLELMKQSATENKPRIDQLNLQIITAQRELLQSQSEKGTASFFPVSSSEADEKVAEQQKTAQTSASEPIYCVRWSDGVSIPGCIAIASYFILYLTSWVLFVAASLFDFTLAFSLSMTDIVNSFSVIQYSWEVFRNLINLFFILILVFISISTILQIDAYGQKKLLGKLVIAAVLINFSMFFTKVIIDASNITALAFYKQIMLDAGNKASQPAAGDNAVSGGLVALSTAASNSTNNQLSSGIMTALGLQTVWGVAKNTGGDAVLGATGQASNNPAVEAGRQSAGSAGSGNFALNPWTMTMVGLGGSVFVLVLSFIFFAASIMFLIRTAVLIILMMTSPIAFAANVLPQTSKLSASWWKRLTSAVLFAPVYMLLMFITLKMVWGRSDKITDLLSMFANNGASTGSSAMNSIFFFILLCIMLGACITSAASIGSMGSSTMLKWGKSLRSYGISKAVSPISRIADRTSRSGLIARIPVVGGTLLQGLDKLAQSKLGGSSSYRSRLEDSKKSYKAKGDLIKNARTGELIMRADETEEQFKDRKKKYEKIGLQAQRKYFGINPNKLENTLTSDSLSRGKQLAMQEIINKGLSAKDDPSVAIISKSKEEITTGVEKTLINVLQDSQTSGHLDAADVDAIKAIISDRRQISRNDDGTIDVKADEMYKLIDKVEDPLNKLSRDLSSIEGEINTHSNAIAAHRPGSTIPAEIALLEENTKKLAALQAKHAISMRKKTELNGIVSLLTSNVKRMQDAEAQAKLKGAIEDNKPK